MNHFHIKSKINGLQNGNHPEIMNYDEPLSNGFHAFEKPTSVGIAGAEFYFPKSYVDQKDLERFDNVSENKYTKGLGQLEMCFCYENEDVCSMALSATAQLLENYELDPNKIGFLAVGTETLIDRSKSVKSVLVELFAESGNRDLEGIDEKNACFGGTQALLHAVDWIYANYEFEGKLAIVVCVDVAIYEQGPARCTGGAGAIALLIAPNSPIVFECGLRAFYSMNVYDFYKPLGGVSTEYPKVDGPNSIETYLHSLDNCYENFGKKWAKIHGKSKCALNDFYAVLFHSPYTRLTQKAFAWLYFVDYKNKLLPADSTDNEELSKFEDLSLSQILKMEKAKTRNDGERFTDKAMEASAKAAEQKLTRHLEFGRRIGNMYTPSLYAQLMNVFLNTPFSMELDQQRILLFSYGSGCVAALFSLYFNFMDEKTSRIYSSIRQSAQRAYERLDSRIKHSPEEFTKILQTRERIIQNGETYSASNENGGPLFPGAFYLNEIDSELRRFYARNDNKE